MLKHTSAIQLDFELFQYQLSKLQIYVAISVSDDVAQCF